MDVHNPAQELRPKQQAQLLREVFQQQQEAQAAVMQDMGEAQALLKEEKVLPKALSKEEKAYYDLLKATILNHFVFSPETYQQKLRALTFPKAARTKVHGLVEQ
uniref:Uncharacterized protein n=1 Tax=Sphaerodactylus townsendi TaxID=933632 RepID=A0ACB8F1D6_9SAUR